MYLTEHFQKFITNWATTVRINYTELNEHSNERYEVPLKPNTDKVTSTCIGLGFFTHQTLTRCKVAAAPFGFCGRIEDHNYNIFKPSDYSFKACAVDFYLALFHQLLPTAPLFLINEYYRDMENGQQSIATFVINALSAVFISYPMLIVSFALRCISAILFYPANYVYQECKSVFTEELRTNSPAGPRL